MRSPASKVLTGAVVAAAVSLGTLVACKRPLAPGANVLVVVADSLRADRLRLYDPDAVETPHLEALAERGVLFENAWTTAPWTAPGVLSVFTGLFPPSHGVVVRDDTTPPGLATLPRLLEDEGYRLGNFSFFSGISYFRNLGFPEAPRGIHRGTADSFLNWLDGGPGEKPFLAWAHLIETHLPYGATGYRAKEITHPGSSGLEAAQRQGAVAVGTVEFSPGDREALLELYDRDVIAMDDELGKMLDGLRERGLLDNTIVIFVADHGEELLEDGWIGHASTAIEAKLTPEILRIPAVVAGPGIAPATSSALIQQVDLFAGTARLLGLSLPYSIDGVAPRELGGGRRERQLAFVDSSVGGNMTPVARRHERVQGVHDGDCLLQSVVADGPPEYGRLERLGAADCDRSLRADFVAALDAWREEQTTQRLELLARVGSTPPPSAAAISEMKENLRVFRPKDGFQLYYRATGGQILLQWQGQGDDYWVEYEVGAGPLAVRGSFPMERSEAVFGPFPVGFWNDLATYNPFRFRVLSPGDQRRSEWREFHLVPSADTR